MVEMKGYDIITALQKKWIASTILADVLIAAGITFLFAVLAHKLFYCSYWWAILYFIIVFGILFFIHHSWRVSKNSISQLLDQKYPLLQESSGLLLQSSSSLNLLEQFQYARTEQALSTIDRPLKIVNRLFFPFVFFLLVLSIGFLLQGMPFYYNSNLRDTKPADKNVIAKPEIILPQVASINISIKPPAYTAKNIRQQQVFNLTAEEGSVIDWQLKTNIEAAQVKFIFNDTLQVTLYADANHTAWHLNKKIDSTGFYQVNIDGKISELYKIETIKDKPPVIILQSPKQYTTIDYGEAQQIKLAAAINDDYGLADAYINATIASGSGEAIKFKEQKIALANFVAGKTMHQSEQLMLLNKMGMQPGDELYFYVQATDNDHQQTRSDIYIVQLTDTAQLMSLEGMANNLSLKPEFFRSERQIIIETEQLLKDKDTISESAFKNRSNNLGIDQKLLRLRYGKFLGDESESGENNTNELDDISNFSDAEKLKDAYTDKHDNAEDATFYDADTKKQLRATLTEMWSAEMRLRTFVPQTALPFEYKALRLLKDLQQKSRAYVAKTNYKTTPLDLKKRLTGDLSKIDQSVLQKDIQRQQDFDLPIRKALSVLEEIKTGSKENIDVSVLQQANLRLHEKAVHQPAVYLTAVEAMKKILVDITEARSISAQNILTAEKGLQQLLQSPAHLPAAEKNNSRQALSKQYFDNLQKKQP